MLIAIEDFKKLIVRDFYGNHFIISLFLFCYYVSLFIASCIHAPLVSALVLPCDFHQDSNVFLSMKEWRGSRRHLLQSWILWKGNGTHSSYFTSHLPLWVLTIRLAGCPSGTHLAHTAIIAMSSQFRLCEMCSALFLKASFSNVILLSPSG